MQVLDPGVLYALANFTGTDTQLLRFTHKKRDGTFENGTTVEEVLKVLVDKLGEFNKRAYSTENELVISLLTQAQSALARRLQQKKILHEPRPAC